MNGMNPLYKLRNLLSAVRPFLNEDGTPRTCFEYDDDPAAWERLAQVVRAVNGQDDSKSPE